MKESTRQKLMWVEVAIILAPMTLVYAVFHVVILGFSRGAEAGMVMVWMALTGAPLLAVWVLAFRFALRGRQALLATGRFWVSLVVFQAATMALVWASALLVDLDRLGSNASDIVTAFGAISWPLVFPLGHLLWEMRGRFVFARAGAA